jgi:hypothetical protein
MNGVRVSSNGIVHILPSPSHTHNCNFIGLFIRNSWLKAQQVSAQPSVRVQLCGARVSDKLLGAFVNATVLDIYTLGQESRICF